MGDPPNFEADACPLDREDPNVFVYRYFAMLWYLPVALDRDGKCSSRISFLRSIFLSHIFYVQYFVPGIYIPMTLFSERSEADTYFERGARPFLDFCNDTRITMLQAVCTQNVNVHRVRRFSIYLEINT